VFAGLKAGATTFWTDGDSGEGDFANRQSCSGHCRQNWFILPIIVQVDGPVRSKAEHKDDAESPENLKN
jgi:hypothetical protein